MITAMFVLALVFLVGMALVMVLARNDKEEDVAGELALLVVLLSAVALAVLAIVLWGMS